MADKSKKSDFGGYATRYDTLCSDGRKILPNAFKHADGVRVPLVWQHLHDEPDNVLGYGLLSHRDDGVYVDGFFNETPRGKNAKLLVLHGDVIALSIYANQLREENKLVHSGNIREVSLVLSGANPGAYIDHLSMVHADGSESELEEEAVIKFVESGLDLPELEHEEVEVVSEESEESEAVAEEEESETTEEVVEDLAHADDEGPTLAEKFDGLPEEDKQLFYALLAAAIESGGDLSQSEEGENFMKKNVFDGSNDEGQKNVLSHSDMVGILEDARANGSLQDAIRNYLQHAGTYGIDDIAFLFPDARTLDNEPTFETRRMGWVAGWMNGTRHTPFSRIKKLWADLTPDAARAKGYITGNQKVEQVFSVLKRTTEPTTIYKKQKLDRDDIVDITDFNVVMWMWREMDFMLREEAARAALVGDGRSFGVDDDAIDPSKIRPIYGDDPIFVHYLQLASTVTDYMDIIDAIHVARVNYKGTGTPTFYTTNAVLTGMLLLKDTTDRRIYKSVQELAAELRVADIVEVEVLEGVSRDTGGAVLADLLGIMVNPYDYTYGTDKGGEISKFDDFDIDYNQYKYLIETRMSGSLLNPKSALCVERFQV